MATFDFKSAREAGATNEQIKQFLLAQPRTEGDSDADVLDTFGYWQGTQSTSPGATSTGAASSGEFEVNGPARWPVMLGEAFGNGLSIAAGAPGNLESWVFDRLGYGREPDPSNPLAPTNTFGLGGRVFPTSDEIRGGFSPLTMGARVTPTGAAEEIAAATATGAGTALPNALLGGGIVSNLVAGLGGGAAAGAAHVAVPDSPIAPLIAGTLGGGLSGAVASRVAGGATAGGRINSLIGPQPVHPVWNSSRDAAMTAAGILFSHIYGLPGVERPMSLLMGGGLGFAAGQGSQRVFDVGRAILSQPGFVPGAGAGAATSNALYPRNPGL